MLKKFIKTSLLYAALLMACFFIIGLFWKDSILMLVDLSHWFSKNKSIFLVYHGLAFLALYFAWPFWIKYQLALEKEKVSDRQIKSAVDMRYWCISGLILLDIFFFGGV